MKFVTNNWQGIVAVLALLTSVISTILSFRASRINLSISQFNIFNKEFEGLLSEARNMKFQSELEDVLLKPFRHAFESSNGIYYINLFLVLDRIEAYQVPNEERSNYIIDFRQNVIFPILKLYDKLDDFLRRIKADKTINDNHRKTLYYYIERDMLPIYFRVCNNKFGDRLSYNLSSIETKVFKDSMFKAVNNFYKSNKLFQFKDLCFYERTL